MIDNADYIQKKKELHFYIQKLIFLDAITIDSSTPYNSYINENMKSKSYEMKDFIVILKSNTFMMMYNMIESTIKQIIWSLYDQVNSEQIVYTDLIDKLKVLWQKYSFLNLDNGNAKTDKYKDKAKNMIDSIINSESIKLRDNQFKLSGNADFDSILTIMQNHGIDVKTNQIGPYKNELKKIKDTRNNLAHGSTSFIESARDTTVNDLKNTNAHVEKFLDQLISDTNDYIRYKRYKQRAK